METIATSTGNDYITITVQCFEEISPQRNFHGISTQIIAQIKNVRVSFNIYICVGDVVAPKPEYRKINTQLPDLEAPTIKTYIAAARYGLRQKQFQVSCFTFQL